MPGHAVHLARPRRRTPDRRPRRRHAPRRGGRGGPPTDVSSDAPGPSRTPGDCSTPRSTSTSTDRTGEPIMTSTPAPRRLEHLGRAYPHRQDPSARRAADAVRAALRSPTATRARRVHLAARAGPARHHTVDGSLRRGDGAAVDGVELRLVAAAAGDERTCGPIHRAPSSSTAGPVLLATRTGLGGSSVTATTS